LLSQKQKTKEKITEVIDQWLLKGNKTVSGDEVFVFAEQSTKI
jgi:hypothetical protein